MARAPAFEPARNRGRRCKNPWTWSAAAKRAVRTPRLEARRPSACCALVGRRDAAPRRRRLQRPGGEERGDDDAYHRLAGDAAGGGGDGAGLVEGGEPAAHAEHEDRAAGSPP